ncbi:hypothetical protein ACTA71_001675 [Dictyostelium dimigraforme]
MDHMEGHSLVARMEDHSIEFPFLTLLVSSGGHTQILKCNGVSNYQLCGTTLDDSIGGCGCGGGEALDKAARIIGCPYGQMANEIKSSKSTSSASTSTTTNYYHHQLPITQWVNYKK